MKRQKTSAQGRTGSGGKKHPDNNIIFRSMRSFRRRFGVSQADLSRALHSVGVEIGRIGIGRIENGTRRVKDFELAAIARVLSVRAGRLLVERRRPQGRKGDNGSRS